MKKKHSKKFLKNDSNQLSFDFTYKVSLIEVHIPKAKAVILDSFSYSKRLAISLADS